MSDPQGGKPGFYWLRMKNYDVDRSDGWQPKWCLGEWNGEYWNAPLGNEESCIVIVEVGPRILPPED